MYLDWLIWKSPRALPCSVIISRSRFASAVKTLCLRNSHYLNLESDDVNDRRAATRNYKGFSVIGFSQTYKGSKKKWGQWVRDTSTPFSIITNNPSFFFWLYRSEHLIFKRKKKLSGFRPQFKNVLKFYLTPALYKILHCKNCV